MGDGYILYLDDVGGKIHTTVYLKRIYFPVSKLYLHNPDLKQTKQRNLLEKSMEKPVRVRQKYGMFLDNFRIQFLLVESVE